MSGAKLASQHSHAQPWGAPRPSHRGPVRASNSRPAVEPCWCPSAAFRSCAFPRRHSLQPNVAADSATTAADWTMTALAARCCFTIPMVHTARPGRPCPAHLDIRGPTNGWLHSRTPPPLPPPLLLLLLVLLLLLRLGHVPQGHFVRTRTAPLIPPLSVAHCGSCPSRPRRAPQPTLAPAALAVRACALPKGRMYPVRRRHCRCRRCCRRCCCRRRCCCSRHCSCGCGCCSVTGTPRTIITPIRQLGHICTH